jgi:glycosyltransferase involved in cell wall biosynthesis
VNARSRDETGPSKSGSLSFHDCCLVVIPAANQQQTIFRVVRDLRERGFPHIRVIDTGSADSTALRARAAGAEVWREPQCGLGRACPHGLDEVPSDIAWILFCTGDGSDELDDLDVLIAARENADLVVGNRVGHKTTGAVQRLGNSILTRLVDYGWGVRFAGFGRLRLVRREAFEAIRIRHHGSGWNVLMQIRALEARLNIKEVPVRSRVQESRRPILERSIGDAGRAVSGVLQAVARLYFGSGTASAMATQQTADA